MSEILSKFPRIQMEIQYVSEPSSYYNAFDLEVVPTHVAERWINIVGKEKELKIAQLEQEVKELKVHIEYLVDVVDEVSTATNANMLPQEVRDLAANAVASVPEQSLAQHDKEVREKFTEALLGQLPNPPRRVWVSDLKIILEQLQQGEG